ncbi:hypothetical protein [Tabrizicola sp.]|uniref:hypothetical protein n=1 Tax=Tabrizicola sp. TaxID=2005166 RepID=UPI001A4F95F9|nr:hypothetical protein [Tabrizicola sp.]MBL9062751.1 hypothetical protein [Tabrizicola sp.]
MNWAECSHHQEWTGIKGRFDWPAEGLSGFNCEPGTTISDLGGAVAWIWTLPGDWFLRLPEVNKFFELDPLHTGGWASGLLPFAVLMLVIILVDR